MSNTCACGAKCSGGLCDRCNRKIAQDMARALREELKERQRQQAEDNKKKR